MPFDDAVPLRGALLRRISRCFYPAQQALAGGGVPKRRPGERRARDVRGGGELSLEAIAWFCEHRTVEALALREKRRSRNVESQVEPGGMPVYRNYPWAAAAINITRMLAEIVHLVDPGTGHAVKAATWSSTYEAYWSVARGRGSFFALFARLFVELERTWDETKATYMEFPRVIAAVRALLVDLLALGDDHIAHAVPGVLLWNVAGVGQVESGEWGHQWVRSRAGRGKERDGGTCGTASRPGQGGAARGYGMRASPPRPSRRSFYEPSRGTISWSSRAASNALCPRRAAPTTKTRTGMGGRSSASGPRVASRCKTCGYLIATAMVATCWCDRPRRTTRRGDLTWCVLGGAWKRREKGGGGWGD